MRCFIPLLALAAAVGATVCGAPEVLAAPDPAAHGGTRATFSTKAEAEAAAKHFHCTGAHKMGDKWMPCASHGEATGKPPRPKAH